MQMFDFYRHGDTVYFDLNGEEYMFNYQNLLDLPDLDETQP